jgi:SRSO17 transposase
MTQPRAAQPTIQFVDEYCQEYADLFPEVRSFEAFKYLHIGMISELKRKSLPAIARAVGLDNSQGLLNLLTESPWKVERLRRRRLELMLKTVKGEEIILLIDDTGDCKKGKTTDYVKRQYIGNVGKTENGIVAVTAYALYEGMVFPLCFAVYKPRERLKPLRGGATGELEEYHSKPQIAAQMIRDLLAMGFRIRLVLADSAYGESSSNFVNVLAELHLPYILAIRSNHAGWLPEKTSLSYGAWQTFERVFSNAEREVRYMREIMDGQQQDQRFWQITTNTDTLPAAETWYVMSHAPSLVWAEIGNHYGFRTWVEYGLKQSKDVLGWADFRVTDYAQIERWWEIVMSAFTMVSLFAQQFNPSCPIHHQVFTQHPWWDCQPGWRNLLNNLRLIIQPFIQRNYLRPWAMLFKLPQLLTALDTLVTQMNQFFCPVIHERRQPQPLFSSA